MNDSETGRQPKEFQVTAAAQRLIHSFTTSAPPRNREGARAEAIRVTAAAEPTPNNCRMYFQSAGAAPMRMCASGCWRNRGRI
jgi:hypothetical protein